MTRSVPEWIAKHDDEAIPPRVRGKRMCTVEGCDKPHDSRGYCRGHAARFRRHGCPLKGTTGRHKATEFMMNVVIPYDGGDCLPWPFGNNNKGYGVYHHNRRAVGAHVFACESVHGDKPTPSHEVAHLCGNGHALCCNPRHLAWATRAENAAHKIQHGTAPRGTRNPQAKLTEDQVRSIRKMIGTQAQWKIAKQFGVTQMTVSNISRGKLWGWLE